jgi:conjugal transfer/type IV secretion protein DotA/TraY
MKDLASKILSRRQGAANKAARKALKAEGKPKITTGKVLKTLFMPEIGPRISQIGKRFGGFAYFLAQIFYSCRLIPAGHPVLQSANIGYFGFVDVISTAAANLQLRKENTDQIVMFAAVILSMVLLIANGLAIAAYTVFDVGGAMAADPNIVMTTNAAGQTAGAATSAAASGSIFKSPVENTDLALEFLNRVFGASNVTFLGAPGATAGDLGSTAIKDALYAMLSIYSTAMMVIAVIIVLYYAFTVVGESAMTGQPFGKRFNSFWAPIRLVIGLGLLVPLAGGLNAAQYATLFAAKMGSGLASYSWSIFVQKLANTNLISENVPTPVVSQLVYNIVQFEACRAVANDHKWFDNVKVNVVPTDQGTILRWDREARAAMQAAATYTPVGAAVAGAAKVTGVMGHDNIPAACGEIFIPKKSSTIGQNKDSILSGDDLKTSMDTMHEQYLAMTLKIIGVDKSGNTSSGGVRPAVEELAKNTSSFKSKPEDFQASPESEPIRNATASAIETSSKEVSEKIVKDFMKSYREHFEGQLSSKISAFDNKGWMGAGLFYVQISDLNGSLINIIRSSFPRVTGSMVAIPSEEAMKDSDWFWGNGKTDGAAFDNETMRAMQKTMTFINAAAVSGTNAEMEKSRAYRQDFFTTFIIDLFGADDLREFRAASQTNPLADLMALGNALFNKAFDYIGWILGAVVLSGALGIFVSAVSLGVTMGTVGAASPLAFGAIGATVIGGIIKPIAGILIFISTLGAAVGLFIAYVVPLLPLVFFFFAVTAWVLEVVEAMVGLPLWALAHIRIDGDGLGQSTQTGYTVIFGIIVRPFVILFAFIIGIILYSAAMQIIKQMFNTYVGSIGVGEADAITYVIYCIMYATMSFTLAMLCFKQCDQMSSNIMRWFGGSDPRYNDGQPDPADPMRQLALGAGVVMSQGASQATNAINGIGEGVASGVGKRGDFKKADQDRKTSVSALRREQAGIDINSPQGQKQYDAIEASIAELEKPAGKGFMSRNIGSNTDNS